MARRAQNTTVRRELVVNRILDEAAAQFAARGVAGTSLNDIAEGLGMSRTALYHYVGSKEALLGDLVSGITKEGAELMGRIAEDPDLGPVEKLREAVRSHAMRIAESPVRFRLLLLSEGSLDEPLASQHVEARRETLRHLSGMIREATDAGELRAMEPHRAAFALIGMCNWIAWWHQPDRDDSPDTATIADEIADMGVAALRSTDGRTTEPSGDPVRTAMSRLREDLDHLERTLERRD